MRWEEGSGGLQVARRRSLDVIPASAQCCRELLIIPAFFLRLCLSTCDTVQLRRRQVWQLCDRQRARELSKGVRELADVTLLVFKCKTQQTPPEVETPNKSTCGNYYWKTHFKTISNGIINRYVLIESVVYCELSSSVDSKVLISDPHTNLFVLVNYGSFGHSPWASARYSDSEDKKKKIGFIWLEFQNKACRQTFYVLWVLDC